MRGFVNYMMQYGVRFKWAVVFLLVTACIDRIDFDVPKTGNVLVVEGLITDRPGPYTVRITRSFTTDNPIFGSNPVVGAKVSLFADDFYLEDLQETDLGIYKTVGAKGIVGRSYYIVIETLEGKRYISEPELLRPVGEVTDLRAEFEARTVQTANGEENGDRFNIFADGNVTSEPESFVRWKFTGTYFIQMQPQFAIGFYMGVKIATPYECSGYVSDGGMSIRRVGSCTCCTCWVTEPDERWSLGTSTEVTEAGYKDAFVGQVNVNNMTFMEKYHVKVEQMSLTPKAYEFFRQIGAQAEGVGSLFQPSTGAIKGNISAIDSDEQPLGFFYASSVKSSSIFITPEEVPYKIQPPDTIRRPCTGVRGSSNVRPDFW